MKFFRFVFLSLLFVSCSKYGDDSDPRMSLLWGEDNFIASQYETEELILANGMHVVRKDSIYLFEGDIWLSQDFVDRVDSIYSVRSANVHDGVLFWPRCVVPYSFFRYIPDSYVAVFQNAMNEISDSSGVVFRPSVNNDSNKIIFKVGNEGNNSELGMMNGSQIINITSICQDVIVHEIMHSLGFHHEHCRHDRDDYVSINYSNIRPSKWHNFVKYSSGIDFGPFDFDSIMLYDPMTSDDTFVWDTTVPMMYKVDGSVFSANNTHLSSGDAEALRNIYGPPYHRLEIVETLLQDYYDGVNEIYRTNYSAEIAFYEDKECLHPTYLRSDRLVLVDTRVMSGTSSTQTIEDGGYRTSYTIPQGTLRFSLGSYENIDYTVQASPYNVYIVSKSIVNEHVPSQYTFVQ